MAQPDHLDPLKVEVGGRSLSVLVGQWREACLANAAFGEGRGHKLRRVSTLNKSESIRTVCIFSSPIILHQHRLGIRLFQNSVQSDIT